MNNDSPNTGSSRPRWALAAFAALTPAVPPAFVEARQSGSGGGRARIARQKLDRQLQRRVDAGHGGETQRVIVRLTPGARAQATQKLQRRDGRLRQVLSLVDAVAADLPASQIAQFAEDDDVLSVSTDAVVMSDGVASASGAASGEGYSLRATLGLTVPGNSTVTTSFRQGDVTGYAGAVDGGVRTENPLASYGSHTTVKVQHGVRSGSSMLVRFDNLFGTAPHQIPMGSTITSATLSVQHSGDGSSLGTAALRRMLVDWNAGSTWLSLLTSGPGLQFDDVEASSASDATVTNLAANAAKTFSGSGLTATVQAWANGDVNRGWALSQSSTNSWAVRTSDDPSLSNRPVLAVTYRPPVETTTLTGAGITVAVIDSGMLEDGGGTARILTSRDFTPGQANPPAVAPSDAYGHGTHVATLIGGDNPEVKGVAPNVHFVNLKVLDGQGAGYTSHVINAVQWAVANRDTYGIDVINLSLGHPVFEPSATDPLVQAVEAAVRAGIVVVASAGSAPSALTVGAVRTMDTTRRDDDVVAGYSSRGPAWYDGFAKPDVVAPGHRLLGAATLSQTLYSTLATFRGPTYGGRSYLRLSDTSMAAGVASGSVALMLESAKATFKPTPNAVKASCTSAPSR